MSPAARAARPPANASAAAADAGTRGPGTRTRAEATGASDRQRVRGPDRAPRHPREQRVERPARALDRVARQPPRLRRPPERRDRLRRDHVGERRLERRGPAPHAPPPPPRRGRRSASAPRRGPAAPARRAGPGPRRASSSARASGSKPMRRWSVREPEGEAVRRNRARRRPRSGGVGAGRGRARSPWQPQVALQAAQVAARARRRPSAAPRRGPAGRPAPGRRRASRPRPPRAPRPACTPGRGAPPGRRATTRGGACRPSAAPSRRRGRPWPSRAPRPGPARRPAATSSARIASIACGQLGRVHARRDLERAGVRVLDHARAHVVGEALLLAHAEEQPARHPVAQHRVEHRERPGVLVVAPQARAGRSPAAPATCRACPTSSRGPAGSVGAGSRRRDRAVPGPERRRRQPDRLLVRRGRRRSPRPCSRAGTSAPQKSRIAAAGSARMPASSPQISRPSGPSPKSADWISIWQYSDGSSR